MPAGRPARSPSARGDGRSLEPGWPARAGRAPSRGRRRTAQATGAGGGTLVFAGRGASHTAISPVADEHDRLRRYGAAHGIAMDRVRFIAESSHTALLGTWSPEPLDMVLVDGAHSFPFPTLDWMYTAPHLKV